MDPVQVPAQEGAVRVVALPKVGVFAPKPAAALRSANHPWTIIMSPQAWMEALVACAWCCGVLQKRAVTALAMPWTSTACTISSETTTSLLPRILALRLAMLGSVWNVVTSSRWGKAKTNLFASGVNFSVSMVQAILFCC